MGDDLAKKTAAKKIAKKVVKKPAAAKAGISKPAEKPVKKPAATSAAKATEAPASTSTGASKKKPAVKAEKPAAKPSAKPAASKPGAKTPPKKSDAKPEVKTKPKSTKADAKPDAKAATPAPEKSAAKGTDKPGKGKPVAAPSKEKQTAKAPASPTSAKTPPAPSPPPSPASASSKDSKVKSKTDAAQADTADAPEDKKGTRKGITVVEPTAKKPTPKAKPASKYNPPVRPMLLGPGSKLGKPLIPSGPSAPKQTSVLDAPKSKRTKSPLTKIKLDKYRALLLAKRAELFGDVQSMENEALRSESGGLSNTPQHLAEQGSESYDQSLSLNLAAQDRRVIKEIDEALKRIEDGTYGLCELTNLPIPEERLDEIPWARYTIEAARQLEQRSPIIGMGGNPGGYGP